MANVNEFKCGSQLDQVQHSAETVFTAASVDRRLPEERPYLDEAWIKDLIADLGLAYVTRTLHQLFRSVSEALPEIHDLHRQGEFFRAALIAHRTAGSTALFGLTALHSGLTAYERAIADGRSSVGARILQDMPAVLAATIGSLQKYEDLKSLP